MAFNANLAAAQTAIEAHFRARWAGQTPVHWPGDEDFVQPFDAPWVRFSVIEGEGARRSIGVPARYEWVGQVVVQVFTLARSGPFPSDQLCDAVMAALGEATIASPLVRFGTPGIVTVGRSGAWFQRNVRCPYTRSVITGTA